jgi:hypothetical protein
MSKELVSSTEIDAPAEQVWAILTDFAGFKSWNPFIVEAQGRAEVGSQLTLRMQPVGGSAMTLRPTVVEVIDGQVLRWLGRFWVSGLFDADHSFVVKPLGASRTALVQREQFSGLLVPFFRRSLDRGTLPAFEAMNAALKDQAEQATAARG